MLRKVIILISFLAGVSLAGCTKRYSGIKPGDADRTRLVTVWREWPIQVVSVNGESAHPSLEVPFYMKPGPAKVVVYNIYYDDGYLRSTNRVVLTFDPQPGEVWIICSLFSSHNRRELVITKDLAKCPNMRFHSARKSAYGEARRFAPDYQLE